MFDYVPLTFVLSSKMKNYHAEMEKVERIFGLMEGSDVDAINEGLKNYQINGLVAKHGRIQSHYNICDTQYDGQNCWFLKVTSYNRG